MRRTLTTIAILSVLTLAAPASAWAQTNSPAGNQPSESTPNTSAGGPSNQSGSNTGGDDVSGNRTTGGGAGATGGGAAAEKQPEGSGGVNKALVAFLVVLGIVGAIAALSITRRNRSAEQQLESAGKS